jgi:hypothetical protein
LTGPAGFNCAKTARNCPEKPCPLQKELKLSYINGRKPHHSYGDDDQSSGPVDDG